MRSAAFTVVELIVTIGIIAILIAFLLPAMAAARMQANAVACRAQMRDIGAHLLIYANANGGWLFPTDGGTNVPRERRWPTRVFVPAVYNPRVMLCPEDAGPDDEHSYILNAHLPQKGVKYGSTNIGGMNVTEVVLMGEKTTRSPDYYLEDGEFDNRVELYRHGTTLQSNYLFLDLHVSNEAPRQRPGLIDPWDVPLPKTNPTTAPSDHP